MNEVNDTLNRMKEEGKRKLASTSESVRDSFEENKDKFLNSTREATEKVKQKFDDLEDYLECYVKENPWKTVAWSVVAGAVLAKIFPRKSS